MISNEFLNKVQLNLFEIYLKLKKTNMWYCVMCFIQKLGNYLWNYFPINALFEYHGGVLREMYQ